MSNFYLVMGLPGSGKSTYAKSIGCVYLEADMFHFKDGKYQWKKENLAASHNWCFACFCDCLFSKIDVCVSNTFITDWERQKYIQEAITHGYRIVVVEMTHVYGNIHNVPEETLNRMKGKYQKFDKQKECSSYDNVEHIVVDYDVLKNNE